MIIFINLIRNIHENEVCILILVHILYILIGWVTNIFTKSSSLFRRMFKFVSAFTVLLSSSTSTSSYISSFVRVSGPLSNLSTNESTFLEIPFM